MMRETSPVSPIEPRPQFVFVEKGLSVLIDRGFQRVRTPLSSLRTSTTRQSVNPESAAGWFCRLVMGFIAAAPQ